MAQINNQQPKGPNYLLEVDEPLVIPIKKKVRFLVTAADVIHAWWVPDLAVKRDAIPGYIIGRGPASTSSVFTASVRSCAVRTVVLCRLWSKLYRKPNTIVGWRAEEAAKLKALTEKISAGYELMRRVKALVHLLCGLSWCQW